MSDADRTRKRLLNFVSGHRFLKNVMMVSGGTAISQLIIVVSSPIISRIFSPRDFGIVAVYSSVLAILSPIATLRFNFVIPIERDEEAAVNALFTSFLLVFLSTFGVFCFVVIGSDLIVSIFDAEPLRSYMGLLSLGLFGIGCYATMMAWMLRRSNYRAIARTKIAQGASQTLSQIVLGLVGAGPIGLIVGTIIGQTTGVGTLFRQFLKADRDLLRKTHFTKIIKVVKEYWKFSFLGSWSAILSVAGIHLPVLILSSLYGAQVVGSFSFASRIIALPMSLVGSSVEHVFYGEGAKYASSDPYRLLGLVKKTSKNLFRVALVLTIVFVPFGPWLFSAVFGFDWFEAGQYARWLSIMLLFRFPVQPVTEALEMLRRQGLRLQLSLFRIVLVALSLYVPWKVGFQPLATVIVYVVCMIVVYSITYLSIIRAIKQRIREVEENVSGR